MTRVAITGCASRFAQVLLPLLEKDPDVKQIVGIDLASPATTYEKMQFHRCDVRAPELGNLLAGCDTLVHLAFPGGGGQH